MTMGKSARKLAKRFKADENDTKAKLKAFAKSIRPDMSDSQIGPVIKSAIKDHGWDVAASGHATTFFFFWFFLPINPYVFDSVIKV